ncbi:hypothetical protein [Asticcacaulis tiandongensis]|nr:hypothetical protein [Asticcacaulis tiandongensis]
MAKGQKRSTKEIRKPKAEKPKPGAVATPLFSNGSLTPGATRK